MFNLQTVWSIALFVWVCLAYKPYFFSQRTIFFSHTKSANSTFSHGLSAKQAQTNRATVFMACSELLLFYLFFFRFSIDMVQQ